MNLNKIIPVIETDQMLHTVRFYRSIGFMAEGDYNRDTQQLRMTWNDQVEILLVTPDPYNRQQGTRLILQADDLDALWEFLNLSTEGALFPIGMLDIGMRGFRAIDRRNTIYFVETPKDTQP